MEVVLREREDYFEVKKQLGHDLVAAAFAVAVATVALSQSAVSVAFAVTAGATVVAAAAVAYLINVGADAAVIRAVVVAILCRCYEFRVPLIPDVLECT